jgi:Flp pilus assembly protein TadG
MMRMVRSLWRNADANVAPTVALSLTALIAMGGLAFDYAHLASLDTELQQAADQAALAAATQLDGQSGASARATAAAQSLIANSTLLASTGAKTVTVPDITFCTAFDDSKVSTDDACTKATTTAQKDAARVVWVKVGGRTASYALTPIVAAFTSGTVGGEAVAGLNSAVCKEPPVMMCNPNSDATKFDVSTFIGKGIRLIAHNTGPGGGAYAPGDFGFLDVGSGTKDLSKLMGYGSPPDECVDVTNPSTEPGDPASVINAFNTRFDIFESGDSIGCFGSSLCPPSANSRKDVVMNHAAPYSKTNCGIITGGGGNGWQVSNSPYRPDTNQFMPDGVTPNPNYVGKFTNTPDAMGYPRDRCHATDSVGTCTNGRIGDGNWDIDTYWRVNHPAAPDPHPAVVIDATTGLKGYPTTLNSAIEAAYPLATDSTRSYPTRYQVYRWEMANASTELPSTGRAVAGVGTDYGQPVCRSGSGPGATTADRRTIPIAVVNCTGLTGAKPVNPIDWIDSFLVQPAMARSSGKTTYSTNTDIYVEIIGHTSQGTGGTQAQFIRHDRPYLIR